MTHIRPATAVARFTADESGAVTVDWVVLTAGLVGLGLATMGVISGGVGALTGNVNSVLGGDIVETSFGGAADVAEEPYVALTRGFEWGQDAAEYANDQADFARQIAEAAGQIDAQFAGYIPEVDWTYGSLANSVEEAETVLGLASAIDDPEFENFIGVEFETSAEIEGHVAAAKAHIAKYRDHEDAANWMDD
jgi:hypothetical protein